MSVHRKLFVNDSLYTSTAFLGSGSGKVNLQFDGVVNYDLKLPTEAPTAGYSLKKGASGFDWVQYAGFGQDLTSSSDVQFGNVDATVGLKATTTGANVNVADTVTKRNLGYLVGQNQALKTTSDVTFHNIDASNGIDVTGGSVIITAGNLTLSAGDLSLDLGNLTVSAGATSLKATTVVGTTNITGVTTVDGKFIVDASGDSESIELTGPTNIHGNTVVSGAFEVLANDGQVIQLTGPTTVTGVTTVDGKFTVNAFGVDEVIDLKGPTTVDGKFTVVATGDSESIELKGTTTITGSATVTTNLTVSGDLTVNGTTTTVNTTNLEIKDNLVLLNTGDVGTATGLTGSQAGIEIERGTSRDNVRLLYKERVNEISPSYWEVSTSDANTNTVVGHRLLEADAAINPADVGKLYVADTHGRAVATKSLTGITIDNLTVTGGITLPSGGSASESIATLTASGSLVSNITLAVTTDGAITLTLPNNADNAGKSFTVYFKTKGSSNNVTINCTGELDRIEGDPTFLLSSEGQHVRFTSLGANTWIVR